MAGSAGSKVVRMAPFITPLSRMMRVRWRVSMPSMPIDVYKRQEEYREIANLVKVSTDTGAVGFHGFVTQLYDPADYDVVLVCGPTVMMKNAARLCAEKGTPCFVSMEKKMACGIGACLGCTCETKGGEGKSVCKNGPVFDATEVFF